MDQLEADIWKEHWQLRRARLMQARANAHLSLLVLTPLEATCFVIYGATYTLPGAQATLQGLVLSQHPRPTLLPFAAGAYPEATKKDRASRGPPWAEVWHADVRSSCCCGC